MGETMLEMKKPAGQGRTFETGRGGDPINRKKNMAENDIYVKPCHAPAGLLNAQFMPVICNVASSLASQFLPNRVTQQRGRK